MSWWPFRRRERADVRIREPPVPRAIPLVGVPPMEALATLPRPLRVCPDCGYLGIRARTMDDGVFGGGGELLTGIACPHCAYEGPPAEFDEAEDYVEYVEALHRARRMRG